MSSQLLGWVFALLVLVIIFFALRNARMKEKYAGWWLLIALVVLVAMVPGVLESVASFLGVSVPLNLAFFLGGLALLLMTLQHAVALSNLEDQQRRLVEENALLRERVDTLECSQNQGRACREGR